MEILGRARYELHTLQMSSYPFCYAEKESFVIMNRNQPVFTNKVIGCFLFISNKVCLTRMMASWLSHHSHVVWLFHVFVWKRLLFQIATSCPCLFPTLWLAPPEPNHLVDLACVFPLSHHQFILDHCVKWVMILVLPRVLHNRCHPLTSLWNSNTHKFSWFPLQLPHCICQ